MSQHEGTSRRLVHVLPVLYSKSLHKDLRMAWVADIFSFITSTSQIRDTDTGSPTAVARSESYEKLTQCMHIPYAFFIHSHAAVPLIFMRSTCAHLHYTDSDKSQSLRQ